MGALVLYRGNSNRLALLGLRDAAGDYLSAATVAVTLTDAAGAEVAGATWPVALEYVAGGLTDPDTGTEYLWGCYAADLPYTLEVESGARLLATLVADANGIRGQWELPVLVLKRTE